ncbi:hypothetical protein AMTR_s00074p00195220 [Amborella trichopoda]|uniref:Uncharacterized protein n=1 Tax=Amborella trichopoda TaxID=13333 RepID=W1NQD2_AMBTC|nr:hypothetical protein AMTR_s00074p00195220 [Amborella trichopoda]
MDAVHNHGSKNHAKTFLEAENIEEDDEWVLLSQGKISSNEEDRFAESSDSSSSDSSSDDLELGFRGEPKMGQKVILEPSPAIPEPDCMADGHGYERPMLLRSVHSDSVQAPGVSLLPPRPSDTQGFSSVSKTKSQTPMEWSVASNESLFSFHVGNSSFSRDHVFLFGKSGELTNFSNRPPLGSRPIPFVVGSDAREVEDEHDLVIEVSTDDKEDAQILLEVSTDDKEDARILLEVETTSPDEPVGPSWKPAPASVPNSSSISHHSNDSGTSIRSFAFPMRSLSLSVAHRHQFILLFNIDQ